MKAVKIFEKPHDCSIKKEQNLFVRRMGSGLTEIERRARTEQWLFCPWCGEPLGEMVEVEAGDFYHLYETNSDRSKAIPMTGYIFRTSCGRIIKVQKIVYPSTVLGKICPECLLQKQIFPAEKQYTLLGEIVEIKTA